MSEETAIEKEHKGIEILAIAIPSFNEIYNFGAYDSLFRIYMLFFGSA
jgi:hypothetical protein